MNTEKKNLVPPTDGPKSPFQGTNLYLSLLLLVGSFWGLQEGLANQIIGSFAGLIAVVGATRNWVKIAKPRGFKEYITDKNTWQYISVALLTFLPQADTLVPQLKSLVDALFTGNWTEIVKAGISLLTILYFLVIKPKGLKVSSAGVIVFIFIFSASSADAQVFNRYKRHLKQAAKEVAKDTSDIVLDPIESVPSKKNGFTAEAATNWGVQYLLPADLRQRLVNECTNKVTIKVYDTAGKSDHASLKQGQLPGSNYTTSTRIDDLQGHGTHCAGIIAADELGLCDALVDKGLVRWKPVKILGDNGSGSFDWVKTAIAAERADDRNRIAAGEFVVCSGSFGGGTGIIENVDKEIQASTDFGVIFIFAAGNSGTAGVGYPGCGKYSIACGSLDQGITRSSFSSTGVEVWAGMPGRNINSTYLNNTFATLSGTSMATPFLSGACAIALSKWGGRLANYQVMKNYLAWCCQDLGAKGKDNETGWGIELIKNILDRNPIDAPDMGNPGNPGNPDPGNPPTREKRMLTFDIAGPLDVYWSIVEGSSLKNSKDLATVYKLKKGKSSARAALSKVTIDKIVVEYESTTDIKNSAKAVQTAVKSFFQGRGFGLVSGSDSADAVYWASYFLELILETQNKPAIKLDTIIVSAKDQDGVPIVWSNRLLHYPRN